MLDNFLKNKANDLKDSFMNNTDEQRSKHADSVIRSHIMFSMGFGLIPIPIVDIFAVSAMQLDMIRQLCKVYDKDFSESQGKAIVSSLTSATLARLAGTSLAKMIPIVGSIVGGVTNSAMAGASTFALGEVFKLHFETGGTILDFDTKRLKKMYAEKFEKGKKVAEELRKQQEAKKNSMADAAKEVVEEEEVLDLNKKETSGAVILAKLKELADLKEQGIITDEEFDKMKTRLIAEF